MAYEVFWIDLSDGTYSGFEVCPTVEMAVEFARVRLLFSSLDSFAFVTDLDQLEDKIRMDAHTHRLHWNGTELVVYDRGSPDWNKPRVRP